MSLFFRLLFDRDTGRPKGYGFCEFLGKLDFLEQTHGHTHTVFIDAETAASAVRNLNDYEIGGRQLRVDYAAMDDNQRAPNHQGGNSQNNNFNNQNRHSGGQHHPPPPMAQVILFVDLF